MVAFAFITSNPQAAGARDTLAIHPTKANGLKAVSIVRFDKIATLEKRVIAGKLGAAEPSFLAAAAPVFFGVFGFAPQSAEALAKAGHKGGGEGVRRRRLPRLNHARPRL